MKKLLLFVSVLLSTGYAFSNTSLAYVNNTDKDVFVRVNYSKDNGNGSKTYNAKNVTLQIPSHKAFTYGLSDPSGSAYYYLQDIWVGDSLDSVSGSDRDNHVGYNTIHSHYKDDKRKFVITFADGQYSQHFSKKLPYRTSKTDPALNTTFDLIRFEDNSPHKIASAAQYVDNKVTRNYTVSNNTTVSWDGETIYEVG